MPPPIDAIFSFVLSLPATLAAFVFVLGIVVAVHEAGHLYTGRAFGIKADAFSLGFGKCLWSRTDRHGTEWRLCLIPLGGYVKFRGDKNAASQASHETLASMTDAEKRGTFFHASLIARTCTIVAGPLTNILLAVVAFAAIGLYEGEPVLLGKIGTVTKDSPAAAAGVNSGDIITAINGVPTPGAKKIIAEVERNGGNQMSVSIRRGSETLDLSVTPIMKDRVTRDGKQAYPIVGVSFTTAADNITHVPMSFIGALQNGFLMTYRVADVTLVSLKRMITGQEGIENLSGPVRLAAISGDLAETRGLHGLVLLIAVVSVSIGLMNLLPIPVLDGGHLLMFAYEAVARRRPNKRVEQFSYGVGLACVMSLMIFATLNDIAQLAFN